MRVIVRDQNEAVEFCRILQKIVNRIETTNIHDIDKISFSAFLCRIRDSVGIEEEETE